MLQYSAVSRLGIADAAAHLGAAFPDDLTLRTALVGAEVAALADSTVEEAVSSSSW